MVIDTSALVAIVLGEPDAERWLRALTESREAVKVSAVSAVESAIVVEARQGLDAGRDLQLLLDRVDAQVSPCTAEQVSVAVSAWRRFGKGRHPAGLNLGDCFSYALARTEGDTLLFTGRDFAQTDVAAALL